jgi:membrane dipeptidase
LDGAFGKEQCPFDLETIADLQNLPASFTNVDIQKKMLRLSCMKIVDDL